MRHNDYDASIDIEHSSGCKVWFQPFSTFGFFVKKLNLTLIEFSSFKNLVKLPVGKIFLIGYTEIIR